MFRRSKSRSRETSRESSPQHPRPPPPPAYPNVWAKSSSEDADASSAPPPAIPGVQYVVGSPWKWVMDDIATSGMKDVVSPTDLPSQKQQQDSKAAAGGEMTPTGSTSRRRRNATKKFKGAATLKMEVLSSTTGKVEFAVHGTSSALDGMEDKDELVRTVQRCRCDHLNLSPPAVLINWDVSHDECLNVLGKDAHLPTLKENKKQQQSKDDDEDKYYAVLKEPMGSQGKGIYFVETAEEIYTIIDEHRQRAMTEPDFLDNLIAAKGRIPSWVLQAEVTPALLIKNRRKFHIRTYVVVIEKLHHQDLMDIYIFNRHEIRIAGVSVPENDTKRDPMSHITNGALSTTTERVLLHDVDELQKRGMQEKVEVFVAEAFGKHLLPDMARRVNYSANHDDDSNTIRKFVVAGLDLMVTEGNQLYLLEVNTNPAAPPESTVDESFKEHLKGFLHCLVDLVVGAPAPEFLSAHEILVRKGLAD